MKKTYITPETLTVALGTCQMMAQSNPNVTVNTSGSNSVDAGKVETKEVGDVNVWSEEW
jgi:hypothetical protein